MCFLPVFAVMLGDEKWSLLLGDSDMEVKHDDSGE